MISILCLIALLVGTFLYWSEFSAKQLCTYWSVFIGAGFLVLLLPSELVLLVHVVTAGWFFAHAKLKASGVG